MPGVVGLSVEEARGRLGEAGLDLGSQSEGVSDVAATGEVISRTHLRVIRHSEAQTWTW